MVWLCRNSCFINVRLDSVPPPHFTFPLKPLERPYVRVSGEATVRHVELFIRRKMELSPTCQVSVGAVLLMQRFSDTPPALVQQQCRWAAEYGQSQSQPLRSELSRAFRNRYDRHSWRTLLIWLGWKNEWCCATLWGADMLPNTSDQRRVLRSQSNNQTLCFQAGWRSAAYVSD